MQIVDTNIIGLVAVTQAVAPHMAAQGSGKILNVSGNALFLQPDPACGLRACVCVSAGSVFAAYACACQTVASTLVLRHKRGRSVRMKTGTCYMVLLSPPPPSPSSTDWIHPRLCEPAHSWHVLRHQVRYQEPF